MSQALEIASNTSPYGAGANVLNNAIDKGVFQHQTNIIAVIVITIAVLLFIGFIALLVYFLLKKHKKRQ